MKGLYEGKNYRRAILTLRMDVCFESKVFYLYFLANGNNKYYIIMVSPGYTASMNSLKIFIKWNNKTQLERPFLDVLPYQYLKCGITFHVISPFESCPGSKKIPWYIKANNMHALLYNRKDSKGLCSKDAERGFQIK